MSDVSINFYKPLIEELEGEFDEEVCARIGARVGEGIDNTMELNAMNYKRVMNLSGKNGLKRSTNE